MSPKLVCDVYLLPPLHLVTCTTLQSADSVCTRSVYFKPPSCEHCLYVASPKHYIRVNWIEILYTGIFISFLIKKCRFVWGETTWRQYKKVSDGSVIVFNIRLTIVSFAFSVKLKKYLFGKMIVEIQKGLVYSEKSCSFI